MRDGLRDLLTNLRRRLIQRKKAPPRDAFAFLVQVVENLHIERERHAARARGTLEVDCIAMGSSPEEEAEARELIERIERRLAAANPRTLKERE